MQCNILHSFWCFKGYCNDFRLEVCEMHEKDGPWEEILSLFMGRINLMVKE